MHNPRLGGASIRRSILPTATALAVFTLAVLLLGPFAQAANQDWQDNGTDFNTGNNWNNNVVPGPGDVARFVSAVGTQPNLSASLTIQELNFSTTTASGFDLTSSNT
ncbi:MAG TPA: hypothetical protein VN827_11295, partial [Chthoniobacterales bacterium]|nr:hypothetical protein [Chthoniobacterales bacterium]